MSWSDRWDDEPPPRRIDRSDDGRWPDSYRDRGPYPGRSGAITAAAVIDIVFASLVLLFGMCVFLLFVVIREHLVIPGGAQDSLGLVIVFSFLLFLWASLAIAAAIGLLYVAQWGRILTLILGGFAFMFGLVFVGLAFKGHQEQPDAAGLFINLLIAMMFFVYCGLNYIILFLSQIRAEFR